MVINIINNNTTIDLSYFENLPQNNINWGDGSITTNTYSHTYTSKGMYNIIADFSPVTKIKDNFNFSNVNFINFESLNGATFSIGNNFLNNNTLIKNLDLSELDITSIGSNFLQGTTNLQCLKVPYKKDISLTSWGSNSLSGRAVIYCGIYYDYYANANVWKNKKDFMTPTDYAVKNATYQDLLNTINDLKFYESDTTIDLSKFPMIKFLLDAGTLKCKNNLAYDEYTSATTPRQKWHSNKEINKSFFVLTFVYNFTTENGVRKYKYPVLYEALSRNGNTLNVKSYKNDTFYYTDEVDSYQVKQNYYANTLVEIDDPQYYYKKNIFEYEPYHELEDPNYAMGKLQFGLIDESNITFLEYDGDHETGFTIRIRVNGVCKNVKIWSNRYDDKLKRKPYIFINTDRIEGGMLKTGDYIEINTRIGKKSASLTRNGVKENILKYISVDSSWLKLKHGTNELFCTADTDIGSILNCNINVVYNDLYEGI